MITDAKNKVRASLLSNTNLVSILGGQRVYQLVAPKADEFPRITFFEVDNRDSDFADDVAYASSVTMQIDIWSKGSTSAIACQVDRTMKEQDWGRTLSLDQYEKDTQVYHKVLRYRTKMLENE
ncbi:hypothetical protein J2Z32_003743 [Paenibacillus turicensis]|uniref:DUF3168 domain-containing protein n=1 Tax=Paenibacillus turicensis TaxID=160487 RepID=A0ABS4FXL6_9BACL|nr:DUF3168 domain-containing protein [Paenibacillus turicensis]MBP1907078.1 hypothetical protein [Paenibacillus turicensis]